MVQKYMIGWKNYFYYMCHVDNLKGILEKGILSHNKMIEEGVKPTLISDAEIIEMRKDISVDGKSLWDYANVYFRVHNAMHYRVLKKIGPEKIVILCIKKGIVSLSGTKITDGNAASLETEFYNPKYLGYVLKKISPNLRLEWWNKGDNSKRQIMAECLVPNKIPPDNIFKIIVFDQNLREKIDSELRSYMSEYNINLVAHKNFFNFPIEKTQIINRINLVEGDMFFSDCQTLTVSVNTEGVMGKGLASTVKYMVPDVYVKYQEVLRKGKLKMGKPFLYERDQSIKELLIEEEYFDENEEPTWFLIFPTKNKWRNRSDLEGIEKGLKYLKDNYKKWGIKSLALPALGCGLGWLSWEEVGPIMIKYLSEMGILIEIYLPREIRVPKQQKTKEFLLK